MDRNSRVPWFVFSVFLICLLVRSTKAEMRHSGTDGLDFLKRLNDQVRTAGSVVAYYQLGETDQWSFVAFDGKTGAFAFGSKSLVRLRTPGGDFFSSKSIDKPLSKLPPNADGEAPFTEVIIEAFVPIVVVRGLIKASASQQLQFDPKSEGGFCVAGKFPRGRWFMRRDRLDEKTNPDAKGIYCFDSLGFLYNEKWGQISQRNVPSDSVHGVLRVIDHTADRPGGWKLISAAHFETAPGEVFDPSTLTAYIVDKVVRPLSRKNLLLTQGSSADQSSSGSPGTARDGTLQALPQGGEISSSFQSRALLLSGTALIGIAIVAWWRRSRA